MTEAKNYPAWACRRWDEEDHNWLNCHSCQRAYEADVELQTQGSPGILHWSDGGTSVCGAPSAKRTTHLNAGEGPADESIDGDLYLMPRVTCPLCRDEARELGMLRELQSHDRPDPYTREAIIEEARDGEA